MSEFRQALDAFLAGQIDLAALKRVLSATLTKEPHLGAAAGAYVEALYRGNRIAGQAYLALVEATRAVEADKTRFRAPGAPAPHTPAPPSAPEGDKTVFRTPKAVPSAPAGAGQPGGSPPSADDGGDKTRFRTPRPTPPAEAPPSAAPPDATRLRPRPVAGTSEAAIPSREPVAAGTDSSWSPATGSHTGSNTGSTGSTWSDPNRWSGGRTVALAVGSIIKERFVLEDELGRGGMGIVFKARDLRMEEAQDRNPYVAVKILNDEFKRHPESLKALQREFRKAQSLAHPNVVTVGDFDRDGGNVFMTMELLDGEPLDQVIKRTQGSGLEKRHALRIT
ncbi:MAG: protein kinase domain-containing protein, partial [Steroidobacteraceae bacterium]